MMLDGDGEGRVGTEAHLLGLLRNAEDAVRRTEERFQALVQHSADAVVVCDLAGRISYASPAFDRLFGWPPGRLRSEGWPAFVLPEDHPIVHESLAQIAIRGPDEPYTTVVRVRHAGGGRRWVEVVSANHSGNAAVGGIVSNVRDVSARMEVERAREDRRAAERERERLMEIFAMTSDHVSTFDVTGHLVYINEAARRFLGYEFDTPAEIIDVQAHLSPATREMVTREIAEAIAARQTWTGEMEVIDRHGAVVPMQAQLIGHRGPDGTLLHVSSVMRDISERKSFERQLRHEATHDPLTSLPNRTLMLDRLGTALDRGRRHASGVALLFCDVDHFKAVNDRLGHGRGDRVLAEVARRLRAQLRPGDTVSRFGGDEFVILGEDCPSLDDAIGIATRVERAMHRPFDLDGVEVRLGVSIGISLAAPGVGAHVDPESLIRDADAAMYRAKEEGRGRFHVFEAGQFGSAADRVELQGSLRRAVARDELAIAYQPVVELGTAGGADIVGAEARLRWDHPVRGPLWPGDLVGPLDDDLVVDLASWFLEAACRQLGGWLGRLPATTPFNLVAHLSRHELDHPGLVPVISGALRAGGVPPHRLSLAVDETLAAEGGPSDEVIVALDRMGVGLCVDVGSRHAPLSYLRRLPVDRLRIDPAFVAGLGREPEDEAVVGALVGLAHSLGLEAVGEGVETADQARILHDLGCDLAQGRVFGRPMTGAELTDRLVTDAAVSDPTRCTRGASGSRSATRPGGA